ncbi:ATP-dependent RNA helicase DDX27, putative [Plasmodium vinckei]|uniref:ATP-dependent RNA helicase n=1 Tax=Plasmodium vinckei TaxID=5860 RepID=A0A6V7T4J2_PLAVN|nr:ATP-dependent RNA helicase DDX27, putative [Plasmodium vinckei]
MFITPFLILSLFSLINSYNINKFSKSLFPYVKVLHQNVRNTKEENNNIYIPKDKQKEHINFNIENFPVKNDAINNKDLYFFKNNETFSTLHVQKLLVEELDKNNIQVPSIIQSDLLKYYNKNSENLKNIIIAAENGIGKTLSYIIFILNHILKKKKNVFVLIFQYNSLLSNQCYDILKRLSRDINVKITCLKNDETIKLNTNSIVISSPIKFVAYMKENKDVVTHFLENLNFFIIDEVDIMFDKPYIKYISEVYEEIDKLNSHSDEEQNNDNCSDDKGKGKCISIITSSTLSNKGTKSVYNNIINYIKDYVMIKTTNFHNIHPFINYNFINLPNYNINQKIDAIKNILLKTNHKKVIIFCNTVKSCNTTFSVLKPHFDHIYSFNSSLKKEDQILILDYFKNSEDNVILVSTDIIHRGIDIKNITHLFHFDTPTNIIVYTHRNGRISRGANTGDIYIFNDTENLITKKIYDFHKNNIKFEDIFSRKRSLRKNYKKQLKKIE